MRVFTYLLFIASLGLLLPMPAMFAGDKGEPGFTPIFNGKNFDGWRTAKTKKSEPLDGKTEAFKGRFKVEKGAILIDYTTKGDSYIETTKEFGKDVHIKFEFKPGEGCNNDFFLRGSKFDITPKLKGIKDKEWNTLEIIVTGDKIEHKLNGESVRKGATAKPKDDKGEKTGTPFMIRAEFGVIEIKNIRVKE